MTNCAACRALFFANIGHTPADLTMLHCPTDSGTDAHKARIGLTYGERCSAVAVGVAAE